MLIRRGCADSYELSFVTGYKQLHERLQFGGIPCGIAFLKLTQALLNIGNVAQKGFSHAHENVIENFRIRSPAVSRPATEEGHAGRAPDSVLIIPPSSKG